MCNIHSMKVIFKVSVIIPVYKADKFLEEAVLSASNLNQVGEIILVEDGSPDNSVEICKEIAEVNDKVVLLRHPNGENHGAGASRNLGIQNASFEFIAFLDADDWYLPNRFLKDELIFSQFPKANAAYSSSILEENANNVKLRNGAKQDIRKIIGYNIAPKVFYKVMLLSRTDLFNTNTVTFKKSFLKNKKLFDERLRLHQDTELWYRLIRRGNFYASEVSRPVSVVRRHDQNRITSRTNMSQLKMIAIFIENVGYSKLYDFEKTFLLKKILRLESLDQKSTLGRRIFYYLNYIINNLKPDSYLKKFSKKFANG